MSRLLWSPTFLRYVATLMAHWRSGGSAQHNPFGSGPAAIYCRALAPLPVYRSESLWTRNLLTPIHPSPSPIIGPRDPGHCRPWVLNSDARTHTHKRGCAVGSVSPTSLPCGPCRPARPLPVYQPSHQAWRRCRLRACRCCRHRAARYGQQSCCARAPAWSAGWAVPGPGPRRTPALCPSVSSARRSTRVRSVRDAPGAVLQDRSARPGKRAIDPMQTR